MTAINGYVTLDEIKAWIVTPGQTLAEASTDDTVIERLIESASRYIDKATERRFYPSVETRSFDVPENTLDDRVLWLDDDLLAATTITNGDATTLASTEWNLYPINGYPKYAIRIIQSSDYYWERDSNDNREGVIDVLGMWGYHSNYATRAWSLGSAINDAAGITATATSITVDSGSPFKQGHIIMIDSELMHVVNSASTSLTVVRAENGSTGATHADDASIYIWQPEPDIYQATAEIVVSTYHRRWGVNVTGVATITGAGVVITPQDLPSTARDLIKHYERIV